jgi:hypothetical protein
MRGVEGLTLIVGLIVMVGVCGGLVWALRWQNRMYPKDRERIRRDPDAAQKTRRFETMWTFFSGRDGGGL